ncbi:uncharacterized protein LOC128680653 isoform X3 [Plodia interpunctella]|uniref:uncharacterized protein LOC128680653 isoform X3 n=1 Tax=Plodia interpunctella TaxID=58824 RepID=UPI003101653C
MVESVEFYNWKKKSGGIMYRIIVVVASSILYAPVTSAVSAGPSYRSSIFEDGKPILRMSDPSRQQDIQNFYIQPKKNKKADPVVWMESEIENIQKNFGQEKSKPYVDKLINDAKNYFRVRMNVQVVDGKPKITFEKFGENIGEAPQPLTRNLGNSNVHLRVYSREETEDATVQPKTAPDWLNDLKTYVRYLIDRNNMKDKLAKQLKPIVKSVEKTNGVLIDDVDSDVQIRYSLQKEE